jgi:hypothetical protein
MSLLLLAGLGAALAGPSAYGAVLGAHVKGTGVDYPALKASGDLAPVLADLGRAPEPTERASKMAFWINAYNALTLGLVVEEWPIQSVLDLDGGKVWDTRTYRVAGQDVTLNHIEHQILRPMGDPRVHAALNCASRGCPALQIRAFEGPSLEAQLDAAARDWAARNAVEINRSDKTVQLSQIFDWYGEDFALASEPDIPGVNGKHNAALQFVAAHSSEETARWLRAGGYGVSWAPYDWSVNEP